MAPVAGGAPVSARWSDSGELLLADGSRLAPEGIVLPTRLATDPAIPAAAAVAAAAALEGHAVRLAAPRSDRHGRLSGAALLGPADGSGGAGDDLGEDLVTALLRAGAGYARPGTADGSCAAAHRAAEAEARQEKRGIWAVAGTVAEATDEAGLNAHTGLFVVAEGQVRDVGVTRERVYLNFGARWRQDFTVIIQREDFATILGDSLDPAALRGTRVRVRGVVRADGGPAILARRAGEIERLDGMDPSAALPPPRRRKER
ncbi:hypothetical protein V5F59_15065 [Xanthobacter autotrophicus DSM 431]|uniref:hypothetical protein n=1 Tax=Xanthobacter nonsaccharivorans TaxID=3119912 RepID=UPI00372C9889